MPLPHRDHEVLAYLGTAREAGVKVLASIFFAFNPQTGTPNRRPEHAALERMCTLRNRGLVELERGRVRLTDLGAKAAGVSTPEKISGGRAHHHDATLAAIEHYRRRLPIGTVVVETRLEGQERARRMRGRGVARRAIGALPDATLVLRDASGNARTVALEYVSASYTKAMIADKKRAFRSAYDDVVYYADTPTTAHKVLRVIGEPCQCS